jgi:hypothetical protein
VIICNDIPFDVHTTVTTVGTIPLPNEMTHEQFIDPVDVTTITIPYVGNGQGDGTFSVDIRGPITRIGTVNSPLKVNAGEGTITLEINPNGLLQPNMFVFGEVQLTSFNGEVWTIEIELQAESESAIPLLNNQSTIIGIFFAVCTIWFSASYFGEKKVIHIPEDIQTDEEIHHEFN